jgi:radical SAM superfamily enzyme YgiQ (UPF0313 family)
MAIKYSLITSKAGTAMYTAATIRYYSKLAGLIEVQPCDADYIFISICDPDDLPLLVKTRSNYPDAIIIMGGFESYFGNPYLAWADYIVCGEGYDFIIDFGVDPKKALERPEVLSSKKQNVIPNYNSQYECVPLVRLPGGNRYYYLASRGCNKKCKFCATSWIQPYSENLKSRLKQCVKKVETRNGKITLIGNDSKNIIESPILAAQSVTVQEYLKNPIKYKSKMLHFGIEGWTEKDRKAFGKPISDEMIYELINVTEVLKQTIELFFIIGYPSYDEKDVFEFTKLIPTSKELNPKIYIKMTYFDPCPHTPLGNSKIKDNFIDPKKIFMYFNSINKRIRVFPCRSIARSAWRGVLHRCTKEEAIILGKEPADKNVQESFSKFYEKLVIKNLLNKLSGMDACKNIKTTYKRNAKPI